MMAWFAHHLKNQSVSTGPELAYLRDWMVPTHGAWAAYGTSTSITAPAAKTYYLSAQRQLVDQSTQLRPDTQRWLTGLAALPTSVSEADAVSNIGVKMWLPDINLPGTYAAWTGPTLSSPLDVVGSPELNLRIRPALGGLTAIAGPAGMLSAVAKVYDVAPDGTKKLINLQVAPFRVADPSKPVRVVLPAIVHRFAVGHQVQVVLAGGDLNLRGGLLSLFASVTTGDSTQTLRLPTTPSA